MKYLLLNGSPHKGNTWKLSEQAKKYLADMDSDAEFEEIHLAQENLPFCIGCSNCFRIGQEYCPHFDIMERILKSIEQSDGLIISSTTFNTRETGMLKNFFDHLCFLLHRPCFFTSKALIITTTGGVGGKSSAKSIKSMLKGIGFNKCYIFTRASYSWNNYKPDDETQKMLKKMTSKFYCDVKSNKLYSPGILALIPYNLFRGMALSIKDSEYHTIDGDHWSCECRNKTIYDPSVKVPFYLKPIGQMFYWIGKIAGRKVLVTYRK